MRKVAGRKAVVATFDTWLAKAPDAERFRFVEALAETANKRNKELIGEFLDTLDLEEGNDEVAAVVEVAPKVDSGTGSTALLSASKVV